MVAKKVMLYGTAVVLSGAVMVTSGLSAKASGQEGYQVWKTAIKTTHQMDSATLNGTMKIADNGQAVITASVGGKGSVTAQAANGSLTVEQAGVKSGISFYHQDGQTIAKFDGDDTYYVSEADPNSKHGKMKMHHEANPSMEAHMEKLMDALVGKYRTYMKLEDGADQTKVVTLSLDDKEMPALLNAAGSLVLEKALSGESEEEGTENPFHDKLNITKPEIGTDVHLAQLDMKTVVGADNYIREQSFTIEATSKDAQGKEHTWTFATDLAFSDLNQTTVDKLSLDGKTIKTMEGAHH